MTTHEIATFILVCDGMTRQQRQAYLRRVRGECPRCGAEGTDGLKCADCAKDHRERMKVAMRKVRLAQSTPKETP